MKSLSKAAINEEFESLFLSTFDNCVLTTELMASHPSWSIKRHTYGDPWEVRIDDTGKNFCHQDLDAALELALIYLKKAGKLDKR